MSILLGIADCCSGSFWSTKHSWNTQGFLKPSCVHFIYNQTFPPFWDTGSLSTNLGSSPKSTNPFKSRQKISSLSQPWSFWWDTSGVSVLGSGCNSPSSGISLKAWVVLGRPGCVAELLGSAVASEQSAWSPGHCACCYTNPLICEKSHQHF